MDTPEANLDYFSDTGLLPVASPSSPPVPSVEDVPVADPVSSAAASTSVSAPAAMSVSDFTSSASRPQTSGRKSVSTFSI